MKRPKHFIPLLEPAAVDQRHDRAEVLNYDLEGFHMEEYGAKQNFRSADGVMTSSYYIGDETSGSNYRAEYCDKCQADTPSQCNCRRRDSEK